MKISWMLVFLFALSGSAFGQSVGEVNTVDLSGGITDLVVDFSEREYELILYSNVTDEPDSTRTYDFTVSNTSVSSSGLTFASPSDHSNRNPLEAVLRLRERELARRVKGGVSGDRRIHRP